MRVDGVWFGVHPHSPASPDAVHRVYAVVALDDEEGFEELWARQVGPELYEVAAIPCYAYDLAFGDTVRTEAFFGLDTLIVERTGYSGHGSVRVGFDSSDSDEQILSLTEVLAGFSERHELVSRRWLGLDVATEEQLKQLESILKPKEAAGELVYELGETVRL